MAASPKLKASFLRQTSLLQFQRLKHTFVKGGMEAELVAEVGPKAMVASGHVDSSKWKKLDSRSLGITMSMIPDASRIVLRILQSEGHDAYLVGGCVRDLLLNRVPKDFDVITTANLQEIKRQFHRALIIGRRFPICKVFVRGSAIEVSSFETVARDAKEKENIQLSKMPKGYNKKDFMLWENAMKRDFTINSLFYDPFAHKVYDYSSAMEDLTSMKLRTLAPAHLSFQEDCARILRGLRIAARLRLSIAKDTEKAMHNLYTSVRNLDKARLMMELNYMLSYGAAGPSLLLLKRFNLLELLLPFHAAYINNQSGAQTPLMLMKLFFNLDSIVSCDEPCDVGLWVGLLAFHLALVNHPQDALVVWTFSSALYHGKWKKGVEVARQLAEVHVDFVPEILEPCSEVSDDELAHRVANFASLVQDAVDALTDSESLLKAMTRYPSSPCSGFVFVSDKAGKEVAKIFKVLVHDIKSLSRERHNSSIDYKLLVKGDIEETRFVLGKVITDTMRSGITRSQTNHVTEGSDSLKTEQGEAEKPDSIVSELERPKSKKGKRGLVDPDDQLQVGRKKQKQNGTMQSPSEQKLIKEKLSELLNCGDIEKKKQQLKKGVVTDVNKLLSQKKSDSQRVVKLERRKDREAQMLKHKEVEAPNEMPETTPKLHKEFVDQDTVDVQVVQKKTPKMKQRPKSEGATGIMKALRLPKLFKGERERTKKEARSEKGRTIEEGRSEKERTKEEVRSEKEHIKEEGLSEKEQIKGEQPSKRIQALSSIFK